MLKPVLTAPPAADVLDLAEVKGHLNVDDDDSDAVITGLIAAATTHIDGYSGTLGRGLIEQSWSQSFEEWPSDKCQRLALAPVSAIVSVTYRDTDNVEQTVAASNYALLEDAVSPYVRFDPTFTLPSLYDRHDAVTYLFKVGYGTAASDVPQAIRQAMLLIIGHYYENREAVVTGTIATVTPMAADALLAPYVFRPNLTA